MVAAESVGAAVLLVAAVPTLAVAVGWVGALARARLAALLTHGDPARRRKRGGRKAALEQREHELRVSVYRRNRTEEEEEAAVECAFCLSGVEEGDEVRELRCRHLFHRGCLDRWLVAARPRPTCPLCRSRLMTAPPWDDEEEEEESDEEIVLLMAYMSGGGGGGFRWWFRPP